VPDDDRRTPERLRRAAGRALPATIALGTAGAVVAGILAIGPRLHPAAVAARPTSSPSPSASAPAGLPTLLPISTATPAPTAAPTPAPTLASTALPIPTGRPHPTPWPAAPWDPPPQNVSEPQVVYVPRAPFTGSDGNTVNPADVVDWDGTVHRVADLPDQNGQDSPNNKPTSWLASPDGSHLLLNGTTIVGPDGSTQGTLPGGADWVAWDSDNTHFCRLDGANSTQLSWVSPGSSRRVATLPPLPGISYWWVLACDSQRNRIVVIRVDPQPDGMSRVEDVRAVELSTGRAVHDITTSFPENAFPVASGDGTVMAIQTSTSSTNIYDTDTGALLRTAGYRVVAVSWYGGRALVTSTAGCCNDMTYQFMDWRQGTVLWSVSNNDSFRFYQHELSDDLGMESVASQPDGSQTFSVTFVKAGGAAATHTLPS